MKLLIIRLSSIGDIVLTSPVIRCLKKQVPDVDLHFIVKPQFKAVVANNPYIDKIHLYEGDRKKLVEQLKKKTLTTLLTFIITSVHLG
jgi:heptosyltransferase-2